MYWYKELGRVYLFFIERCSLFGVSFIRGSTVVNTHQIWRGAYYRY